MTDFNFKVSKNEKNKNFGFTPLDEGTYECLIDSPSEEATKGGTEYFQIPLTVRNDLDGVEALKETNAKFHNRKTFDFKIWKRKGTGKYDPQNFSDVLTAVGVPEGTEITSQEQLINFLTGKPVKAFIKKTTDTYKGEEREVNQIAPWNLERTNYPDVQHVSKNKKENSADPFAGNKEIEIDNDELPF